MPKFHTRSLLVGAAVVAAALLAVGATQASPSISHAGHAASAPGQAATIGKVSIAGIPAPSVCTTVMPASPLVVPTGALFVVTGVGALNEMVPNARVLFDGAVGIEVRLFDGVAWRAFVSVPPGLVAQAGTTVSTDDGSVIHGYLARVGQPATFTVDGIAAPDEMMRIVDGTPFVVPTGKRFVATAVCTTHSETRVDVRLDGQLRLRSQINNLTGYVVALSPGLTAGPGTTVTVAGIPSAPYGVLLGYLVAE